jgi:hypothetical protein
MDVDEDDLAGIEGDLLSDTFADFERAVLQDNIALFDTKASAVLAFSGVMVIYCIDSIATIHIASSAYVWILGPAIHALLVVAALGFLVSAMFSLSTVRPRLVSGGEDHVFWDSAIFRLPVAEYLTAMKALDPAVARDDKLRHLHLLAGICRNKIRHFRTSLYVAEGAFLALVAAELARVVR